MSFRSLTTRVAVRPLALSLVLAPVWGGHAAWQAAAKTVTLDVDGHQRVVRTHGHTVADALAAAHVPVSAHDLLAPAKDVRLTKKTSVVLRHGRQMALTVDGTSRTVWVTAMSVDEALQQVGLRVDGAVLPADRSRAIPLKGFSLEVRTRKQVQLLDGGRAQQVATNSLTVAELLTERHIALAPSDRLSPARATRLRPNQVISIVRVSGRQQVDTVAIPFGVVRKPDRSLYTGQTRTVRAGRVGTLRRTFTIRYVNGKLFSRRLASVKRVSAPVAQVIAYGTRKRPYSVAGADSLNWPALARCESGGNPRSVSSGGTYRGLYQFTLGAWHGVGGSGDPIDWGRDEQTYRAKLLYKRSGSSPWPSCGHYLYS